MQQFENAELRDVSRELRKLAQRARAAGPTEQVQQTARELGSRLTVLRLAGLHKTTLPHAERYSLPHPEELPERSRIAIDAVAAAHKALQSTDADAMERAAELFEAAEAEPIEIVPPDADRLRDALQAVLGCARDVGWDIDLLGESLSDESRAEAERHLTWLGDTLGRAGTALSALEPETIDRLRRFDSAWIERIRVALDAIAGPLAGALPTKRFGGGVNPADATKLPTLPRSAWDGPLSALVESQRELFALRVQAATKAEPIEKAKPKRGASKRRGVGAIEFTKKQQAVWELHHVRKMPVAKIAEHLECTRAAVYKVLKAAKPKAEAHDATTRSIKAKYSAESWDQDARC